MLDYLNENIKDKIAQLLRTEYECTKKGLQNSSTREAVNCAELSDLTLLDRRAYCAAKKYRLLSSNETDGLRQKM